MKRRKWNEEGVASTVGTIMALMIMMTLLSMFTNQYVPVWMEDNEAKHMSIVEAQFGNLKWGMDNQILAAQSGGAVEIMVFSPITLGADGVPMFASPTMGFLNINPNEGAINVNFNYEIAGNTTAIERDSSGIIEFYAPNRYYVQQRYLYQNDALILSQVDGQIVKSMPQFKIRQEGGMYRLSFSQISLIGVNKSYSGTGTTGVHTSLRYTANEYYENYTAPLGGTDLGNFATNVTISLNSEYAESWYRFYTNYLNRTGVPYNASSPTLTTHSDPSAVCAVVHSGEDVSFTFDYRMLLSFTLTVAQFELIVGEEGG